MVVRQCIGLLAFASVAASQPAPGGKLPPKVKPGNRRNNNNNNNANNNDPGANVADAEKMGWDYPDELQRMLDDSLMGEEYPDGLGGMDDDMRNAMKGTGAMGQGVGGVGGEGPPNVDDPEPKFGKGFDGGEEFVQASNEVLRDWDDVMADLMPEHMLTVPVQPRGEEFVFEDVEVPGTKLRGGFFTRTATGSEGKITFTVMNPDGVVVYEGINQMEGLFVVEAKEVGMYTFSMRHDGWFDEAQVTIILGVGERSAMTTDDVSDMASMLKKVERTLREAQTETSYFWIRTKGHLQTIESVHKRVFWFSFIEFFVMVGIAGFQVFYIKGLLSARQLL